MTTGPAASFLARLRAETHEAHEMIGRVPAFARLLAPDIARRDVVMALRRLYGFHAAVSSPLTRGLATVPGADEYSDATRLDALAEDLAWLRADVAAAAPSQAVPDLTSSFQALGCLYVIEGSSLGGRIIARGLADRLGLTASAGARFFASRSAEETRCRFRGLSVILAREAAAGPDAAGGIVSGALDTFRCLAAWMAGPEHATAVTPLP